MENIFICYKKCSTCSKARKWLVDKKVKFIERDIKEDRPSEEEIKKWISLSKLPIKSFFNTSGILYRELKLKDKLEEMTDQEKIKLLASDGMLVRRPILVNQDNILIRFKEEKWQEALENKLI